MKAHQHRGSGVITGILLPMGLICLFAFCSLVLALMGGRAYRQIQSGIDDSFGSTVAANYLRTKLTQNNVAGAVYLRQQEDGPMLVIETNVGENLYETRIYMHGNVLRESQVPAQNPHVPENGIAIATVQKCEFTITENGLFTANIISPAGVHSRTVFALAEGSGH